MSKEGKPLTRDDIVDLASDLWEALISESKRACLHEEYGMQKQLLALARVVIVVRDNAIEKWNAE